MSLFDRPERPAINFVPSIERQPITTPMPTPALLPEGTIDCPVHRRALSYTEIKRRLCSWCERDGGP